MAKKAAAKSTGTSKASKKKTVAKKAAVKKTASTKPAAAKKAAAKKSPTKKKAAAKTTAAKKSPANKATAKSSVKKSPAKKAAAKTPQAEPMSEVAKVDEAQAAAAARLKEVQKIAKKAFTPAFLKKQKAELMAEREKYTRSEASYREEADSLMLDREPGDVQFDEEGGEGDSLAVERERDLALSAQARLAIEEIDAALQRMEDDIYGICVQSELPIPKERLEAIPWASVRVEIKVGGLGRR